MQAPVTCGHCGHSFEPTAEQVGGLVTCRTCDKVVEVPGLRDPLWSLTRFAIVLVALLVAIWLGQRDVWLGLGGGALVLAGAWLISRAL